MQVVSDECKYHCVNREEQPKKLTSREMYEILNNYFKDWDGFRCVDSNDSETILIETLCNRTVYVEGCTISFDQPSLGEGYSLIVSPDMKNVEIIEWARDTYDFDIE